MILGITSNLEMNLNIGEKAQMLYANVTLFCIRIELLQIFVFTEVILEPN